MEDLEGDRVQGRVKAWGHLVPVGFLEEEVHSQVKAVRGHQDLLVFYTALVQWMFCSAVLEVVLATLERRQLEVVS